MWHTSSLRMNLRSIQGLFRTLDRSSIYPLSTWKTPRSTTNLSSVENERTPVNCIVLWSTRSALTAFSVLDFSDLFQKGENILRSYWYKYYNSYFKRGRNIKMTAIFLHPAIYYLQSITDSFVQRELFGIQPYLLSSQLVVCNHQKGRLLAQWCLLLVSMR